MLGEIRYRMRRCETDSNTFKMIHSRGSKHFSRSFGELLFLSFCSVSRSFIRAARSGSAVMKND